MPEALETKRWVSFLRAYEVPVYKKDWLAAPSSEHAERTLLRSLPIRDVVTQTVTFRGMSHEFVEISVHGWVDMVADGIAFELKVSDLYGVQPFFISRWTLQESYPEIVTDTKSMAHVLASTLRGVWVAEAEAFVLPSAEYFFRRVPLEETYGYHVQVWGAKPRETPSRVEICRAALELQSTHVRLFGKFVAV